MYTKCCLAVNHYLLNFFFFETFKLQLSFLFISFAELMVLGFISLLLTFGQNYIVQICIPEKAADTMLPCHKEKQVEHGKGETHHRRLLWDSIERIPSKHRMLVEASGPHCSEVGTFVMCLFRHMYLMHSALYNNECPTNAPRTFQYREIYQLVHVVKKRLPFLRVEFRLCFFCVR